MLSMNPTNTLSAGFCEFGRERFRQNTLITSLTNKEKVLMVAERGELVMTSCYYARLYLAANTIPYHHSRSPYHITMNIISPRTSYHHEHHITMNTISPRTPSAEVMMPISALCCLSSVNKLSYLLKYSMRYGRMWIQFIQNSARAVASS